MTNITIEHDQY